MGKRTDRPTGDVATSQPPAKKKKTSSSSSKIEEKEAAFPRGGKSVLSSLEVRKIHQEVKQGLFSGSNIAAASPKKSLKTKKKKKTKKQKVTELDEADLDNSIEGILARLDRDVPTVAESITYQSLTEGATVLGAIKEILPLSLVVTLPGSLTATVPITNISDALNTRLSSNTKMKDSDDEDLDEEDSDIEEDAEEDFTLSSMFTIGQIIRCVVIKKPREEKSDSIIYLSLNPSLINKEKLDHIKPHMNMYGCIEAEEDYGFIVHFGENVKKGFLAKSDELSYQEGEPIECLVEKGYTAEKGSIPVTIKKVFDSVTGSGELTLGTLSAGLLAQVKVVSVLESGLIVRLFDFFNATIPLHQIDISKKPLADRYKKGDQHLARIVNIDYENKKIFMGLKQHLILRAPYSFTPAIGDIFKSAFVVLAIDNLGLYVQLGSSNKQLGFVHISSISDSHTPGHISEAYPVGKEVACRVTDFNFADGIIQGSMKESVMKLEFLQYSDLKAGTMMRGTVLSIEEYGVMLKLTDRFKGLIPLDHLADVMIRKPAAKFKLEQRVKCRVLHVNQVAKNIALTAKKTLLNSSHPLITSYDVPLGTVSHGVIKKIFPKGLLVTFYNHVAAFAPLHEIMDDNSDHTELFNVGQPIQCRVISTSPARKKMAVSFRIVEDTEAHDALEVGSTQSGKVTQMGSDFCTVELEGGVRARLRKFQFSDISSLCDSWLSDCKVDRTFSDLIVLSKPPHRPVEITRKASIIQACAQKTFPSSVAVLEVGEVNIGYVKRISNIGIHIGFLGGLIGFVPKGEVADEYVKDPADHFDIGQSVRVYVVEIDQRKLILSLKQSLCATNGVEYTKNYFKEESMLFRTMKRKNKKMKLKNISVGDFISGAILEKSDLGLVISIDKFTNGLLLSAHAGDLASKNIGTSVTAMVLDVSQPSPTKRILDLSASEHLITGEGHTGEWEKGVAYPIRVELVKSKYLVVSVHKKIAIVPTMDYNSVKSFDPFHMFHIGDELTGAFEENSLDALYARSLLFSLPIKAAHAIPIKKDIVSLSDIQPGLLVQGTIKKVCSHTLKVTIGHHVFGRVHVTEVFDTPSTTIPFSGMKEGDTICCKVIKITDIPSNRHLPISHQNPIKQHRLDLSIKPSKMKIGSGEIEKEVITWKNAESFVGKDILVVVAEIQQKTNAIGVHVSTDIKGVIPAYFLPSSQNSFLRHLAKHFLIGETLKVRVMNVDVTYKSFVVSQVPEALEAFKVPGSLVTGKVIQRVPGLGYVVELAPHHIGFLHITEISDVYSAKVMKSVKIGRFYRFVVLSMLPTDIHKNTPLSLRPSRVRGQEGKEVESRVVNPPFSSLSDFSENQIVSGFAQGGDKGQGITVAISREISAYVPHMELHDKVQDSSEIYFMAGRFVTGLILSVQKDDKHPLVLSIKNSRLREDRGEGKISLKNIQKDQKLKGYVKAVKEYGILIEIKHSGGLVGLCHKTQISDKKNCKWNLIFAPGDYVKVIVLRVDVGKNRLSLGMKPSYFTDDDKEADSDEESVDATDATDVVMMDENDLEEEEEEEEVLMDSERLLRPDSDEDEPLERFDDVMDSSDDDVDADAVQEDSDEEMSEEEEIGPSKALESSTFKWNDFKVERTKKRNGEEEEEEESSESEGSDESESEDAEEISSKRSKKLAKSREEKKVAQTEEEMMSGEKAPETISDFERLLVSAPDDSLLWIKYMAFLLSMTEIEKARGVVERGLKRINLRAEGEKLNLWVAYLNLEMIYGSQESLGKVIERALSFNDPKQVYIRLVDIYSNANKLAEAEGIFERLIKKYKHSKGIWFKYCSFKMKNEEAEEARSLFQRAVKLLPQRKHIAFINKFAQLEYKEGDLERGRTIFEGIISNYPKKIDIWSVYVDMELKYSSDLEVIRRIFERATSLTLSAKKMKFLFTRYLNFEKEFGDMADVERVKEKVMEFLDASNK